MGNSAIRELAGVGAVIEADTGGRIPFQLEIRTRIRSKKFELTLEYVKLIISPLSDFRELKGKA